MTVAPTNSYIADAHACVTCSTPTLATAAAAAGVRSSSELA
jgi:hypothetical protein